MPSSGEASAPAASAAPAPQPQLPPVEPHQTRGATKMAAEEDKKDEFFFICLRNMTELMNLSVSGHKEFTTKNKITCEGEFNINKSHQKLISVSLFVNCTKCKYETKPLKMYNTLKHSLEDIIKDTKQTGDKNKGPRHSTLNVSLALALTASSIDTTQWQEIMGGIGVDAGSESGMRKLMNKVAPLNKKLAQQSMTKNIQNLTESQARGEEVGISFDVMYNNSRARNNIPMQPATQAVGTVIGSNKKTLHISLKNKLCWKCSNNETNKLVKGKTPELCNEKECPRNLASAATISDEASTLRAALDDLGNKGLKPNYCSLDGDAKNANVLKEKNIELSRDVWHLSQNLKKKYAQMPCQLADFDGGNAGEQEREWKEFLGCVLDRCNAELKHEPPVGKVKGKNKKVKLTGPARLNKLRTKMRRLTDAILHCHQGRCGIKSKCSVRSNVCKGNSSYIIHGPTPTLSETNASLVRDMINERLDKFLGLTYRNANTSINEARNRSLTKVLPKNVTRSKNAVSRLYRGTLVNNEGLAGSSKICNTTIGHKRSQNVIRRMSKLEARKSYFIRRSAMIKQKIRRQLKIRYVKDLYKAKRGGKNCVHYGPGIDLDLSSK